MSYGNPLLFTRTNAYGTHCLLEACRAEGVPHLIHVSTDEVYGPVDVDAFDESAPFNPTNPYSASKTAAEVMAAAYRKSYGMDIRVVRGNNLYGVRQYPEKIIPRFITLLLQGKKLTIHGDGRHRRRYLDVEEFCDGVILVADEGAPGGVYNIGTDDEHTNIEVARLICAVLGRDVDEETIHTDDRPFNDRRYAVETDKIRALGWSSEARLSQSLDHLVRWYADNWRTHWSGVEVA
jgi:dTDP-glucose 4,6-dehydratase